MVLYQTVEDRGNPEYINKNAPFECIREDAWLGSGYYFWDTFIDNAHWWGDQGYHGRDYVISKYTCTFNHDRCFDLVGNMEHLAELKSYADLIKSQNLPMPVGRITVSYVIEFLKNKTDFSTKYGAIRAKGEKSKNYNITVKKFFSLTGHQYLDLSPPVQLCLFKEDTFNLNKGEIVHPSKYFKDITI